MNLADYICIFFTLHWVVCYILKAISIFKITLTNPKPLQEIEYTLPMTKALPHW